MDLRDLPRDERAELGVDAVRAVAEQRLSGQLQEDPAVAELAGVRREDSASRAKTPKFALDKRFGLWKLNPLADWTESDVWNYIHEHDLPYNPLHDHGYPSIGCTHCTKPVGPGGSPRDGRWAGLAKTECGIN